MDRPVPGPGEIESAADEFSLHELAIEDALNGHQRPKLEPFGNTLFTVLRPARYLDDVEKVEFGELHVFAGPDFVVTVRHAESPHLAKVRHRLEGNPELLAMGPQAVPYARSWTSTRPSSPDWRTTSTKWRTSCSAPARTWPGAFTSFPGKSSSSPSSASSPH
jgi:hypothetical protein